MRSKRRFHIGEILSLMLDVDLSLRGENALRALQDYVAGRALSETERAKFADLISSHVASQFGHLDMFDAHELPPYEFRTEWLLRRAQEFGEYHEVTPFRVVPGIDQIAIAEERQNSTSPRLWD